MIEADTSDAGTSIAESSIESTLRAGREAGRKLLVPYLTGGYSPDWLDMVRAAADAGADAIEIGVPFSDPVMDGPVIQEASQTALDRGTTPEGVLVELAGADIGVPLAVMTYYNLVFRAGHERFASTLAGHGVQGAILPDLPFVESGEWRAAASAVGVETVLLVAPTTPDDRLVEIAAASRGFLYAVGVVGITGNRAELAETATIIARRCLDVTDMPVLIGVGVSDPIQAVEACGTADGVVIGTTVVRAMMSGAGPSAVGDLVGSFREHIDAG